MNQKVEDRVHDWAVYDVSAERGLYVVADYRGTWEAVNRKYPNTLPRLKWITQCAS